MPGDAHLALDLADGVGDAQHQRLVVIDDAGAGGRKQLIATLEAQAWVTVETHDADGRLACDRSFDLGDTFGTE